MLKSKFILLIIIAICIVWQPVTAHFGMLIPSDSMVMQKEDKTISLILSFSHPFENIGMPMQKPHLFQVHQSGKKIDLRKHLQQTSVMQNVAWKMDYKLQRPGTHVFVMQPEPYWEPMEDCFIMHYTKTVVAAFGDDSDWDKEIGLETEIVPLSKPFGLYTGNVFQGIVKLNGNVVPKAAIEVEYYNQDKKSVAPTDLMITQTIKADQNGLFTYAFPRSGWWGFAALNTAEYKFKYQGVEKEVELGAVIWVKIHDWQKM